MQNGQNTWDLPHIVPCYTLLPRIIPLRLRYGCCRRRPHFGFFRERLPLHKEAAGQRRGKFYKLATSWRYETLLLCTNEMCH